MADGAQIDGVAANARTRTAMRDREGGGSGQPVDIGERVLRRGQRRRVVANQTGQLSPHAVLLDFRFLRRQQETVVELDREQRFDEHCLVGPRAIQHHPGDGVRLAGAHRYDEAAVAQGHVVVTDDVAQGRIPHQAHQLGFDLGVEVPLQGPGAFQGRTGVVADETAGVEGAVQAARDAAGATERLAQRAQLRRAIGVAEDPSAHVAGDFEEVAHAGELARFQRGAFRSGGDEDRIQQGHVGRGRPTELTGAVEHLGEAIEPCADDRRIALRRQAADDGLTGLGARQQRDRVQDERQLQRFEITRPHGDCGYRWVGAWCKSGVSICAASKSAGAAY